MKRINRAVPNLNADVRYLLDEGKVDLDFWYCQECSCEVATFELETPRRVRQRCGNPSCGAPDKCYAVDDPYLSYVVKEVRWGFAVNDCINAFGHSWLETWYYDAPRGH